MAKMLRNTPGIPGRRDWVCRCRHCRSNDRSGIDTRYRRAQRHRERAEVRDLHARVGFGWWWDMMKAAETVDY